MKLPRFEAVAAARRLIRRRGWALAALLALAGCGAPPAVPDPARTRGTAAALPEFMRFGDGQLELQVSGQTCQLRWRGEFPADAVRTLGEALHELERRRCVRTGLALDLRGGDIGPATTLGAMLRNRQFDTALLPGSRCHTPCALVFAAGRQRLASPGSPAALVLLTQVRPDRDFGHAVCETELSRPQQLTLTRYLRAMLPAAAAAALYQKIGQASCRHAETLFPADALELGLATGLLPAPAH